MGGAAPAVWAAWAIEIAPGDRREHDDGEGASGAAIEPLHRQDAIPGDRAQRPMSSAAPTEPPEAGRLHTESMATGVVDENVMGLILIVPVTRLRWNCNQFAT